MSGLGTAEQGERHAILHEQGHLRLPTLKVGQVVLPKGEDDAHGGISKLILISEGGVFRERFGEVTRWAVLQEVGHLLQPVGDFVRELGLGTEGEYFFELVEDEDGDGCGRGGAVVEELPEGGGN